MPVKAGLRQYFKKAFLFPWNMLAFLGGMTAAVLSPWPDAIAPLLMAGELAYLVGLTAMPRFRAAVDAEVHAKQRRAVGGQVPPAELADLLGSLPPESRMRFHKLRLRCIEMQKLAAGTRGQSPLDPSAGDDLRRTNLDRLLWIFLRLLVSQESMRRFLRSTSELQLTERIKELENELAQAKNDQDQRLVTSLTDSLALANLRLDNYRKADKNARFVMVELDRIESKIQAMTEMMVNRQDPDLLTSQVDQAAQSMSETETAMKELESITGMVDQLTEPPPILNADLGALKHEA